MLDKIFFCIGQRTGFHRTTAFTNPSRSKIAISTLLEKSGMCFFLYCFHSSYTSIDIGLFSSH